MQNVLWHSVPRMPLAIGVEVWWVLPRGVSQGGGRVEPRGNRPCTAWIPKKALGTDGAPFCVLHVLQLCQAGVNAVEAWFCPHCS